MNVDANTLALWNLDETSSTANAVDTKGAYPLTQTGNPAYGIGGRHAYNGVHYFSHPGDAAIRTAALGDMTFEAWVLPNVLSQLDSSGMIFAIGAPGETADANVLFAVTISGMTTGIGARHEYGAGVDVSYVPGAVSKVEPGRWSHIAVARLANVYTIYINGAAVGSSSALTPPDGGGTAVIWLGRGPESPGTRYWGWVARARLSNVARTWADVLASYQEGPPHAPGLIYTTPIVPAVHTSAPEPWMTTEAESGDFALAWSNTEMNADMVVIDDDILVDEGIRTAAMLSIYTDCRANDDDELSGGDRRGWWADEFAVHGGDRIGSRLWLLDRGKRMPGVTRRAEEMVREALAWMLEDKIAARIDVEADARTSELMIAITIHRAAGDPVSFKYAHAWRAEEGRST